MVTITALLTLLFLLIASTTNLKFAIASGVRDTDGNMVENGGDYSILPSFNGKGGGVTHVSIGVRHPPAVVLSASKGLPVSISSNETMVILTDDIVSIKFSTNIPNFDGSSTWMLVMDESAKVWYLGIGSAQDYPSHQIKMGRFQIKEYNLDYKFVFCSDGNTSSCEEDVGIYIDSDKNNRLALYGGALAVKFKNADKVLVACE